MNRTRLAFLAMIPTGAIIALISNALEFGEYARLGALLVGMILISLLDPEGFGWREPADRRH